MARRAVRLTHRLIDDIALRIRSGAYEQVAVESLGVPWKQYAEWLERGQHSEKMDVFAALADAVMSSKAHARLHAEVGLRQKDFKTWLLHGPGRETPSRPGWAPSRTTARDSADAREVPIEIVLLIIKHLVPEHNVPKLIDAFQAYSTSNLSPSQLDNLLKEMTRENAPS